MRGSGMGQGRKGAVATNRRTTKIMLSLSVVYKLYYSRNFLKYIPIIWQFNWGDRFPTAHLFSLN